MAKRAEADILMVPRVIGVVPLLWTDAARFVAP